MDRRRIERIYQEYVVAHNLERTALLEQVRARCKGSPTVLYPGSFVHLTPSFFFQQVVYVDRSDFARAFFRRIHDVLRIVDDRKRYRLPAHVRFEARDFTAPLPFPDESFDVLLALYAPGVSRACARYVKPGGLVLTNDHHGDAKQAAALGDLELMAFIQDRGDRVRITEEPAAKHLAHRRTNAPSPRRTRAKSSLVADHYLFRKLLKRRG